MGNIGEMQFSN